ncbi:hypothetical protein PR048_001907 [Dryococelus australis]|uniref:Uncharacterized protein n=1 Tax=Dryococelus australis TaxID=614101 RepID=A0ABQ9IIP0_9NEOP|nr:hypothetical protein PR048_001907 [Dryococelus australis]
MMEDCMKICSYSAHKCSTNKSRTGKLWLKYLNPVLMLNFIRAEKKGNWKLHIPTTSQMMSLFHTAGHIYIHCAWIDMNIEQLLMRSMKYLGGLRRGRGLNEDNLMRWILCPPVVSEIATEVEDFAGSTSSCDLAVTKGKESM